MEEQRLSPDLFEPLIGRTFDIGFVDGTVHLTLRSVSRLAPPHGFDNSGQQIEVLTDARKDPFTLLFGDASHLIPQRIYHMTSEALQQPIDIFIVPVGRDGHGFIYEAVFC